MHHLSLSLFAFIFVSTSLASRSYASFYPPDYQVDKLCQEQDAVRICTINHYAGKFPRIEISYRGYLMQEHWGRISVWVKLNGREGRFPMQNKNYEEVLRLNQPRVYLCYVPRGGGDLLPPGPYGLCRQTAEPKGELVWEAEPAPTAESALFFFARDEQDHGNAWDIELAFVAEDGSWDSRLNENYVFRFD